MIVIRSAADVTSMIASTDDSQTNVPSEQKAENHLTSIRALAQQVACSADMFR
ncbi:hypothetical protein OQA88_13289, partial [Cercophora sp. LCS_1]